MSGSSLKSFSVHLLHTSEGDICVGAKCYINGLQMKRGSEAASRVASESQTQRPRTVPGAENTSKSKSASQHQHSGGATTNAIGPRNLACRFLSHTMFSFFLFSDNAILPGIGAPLSSQKNSSFLSFVRNVRKRRPCLKSVITCGAGRGTSRSTISSFRLLAKMSARREVIDVMHTGCFTT